MMKASLYPLLLQILLTLLLNISTSEGLSSSLQRKGGRTMPMTTTTQPSNDAITINRHFQGDIFVTSHCSKSFCDSNGTRGEVIRPGGSNCECQCKTNYPIYREDRKQCVKDFPECMLADFISGSASEKIPFVFMPLPGQLIYPSAEIAISDVDTHGNPVLAPICVVSGVDILEATGWRSFENISGDSFQQPFQLHRNDDKTYLQWLGDDKLRKLLEGRLVLVHLLCKDTIRHTGKQLFSPCVAFRVAGSPGPLLPSSLHVGDGRSSEDDSEGLSFGDYLAIGVCVAFLGIIYIIAIIFFIFMKRKKRRKERLRRQFLKPPSTLPPGLRYKSSVLLGLEAAFVTELQKNARNNGGLHLNHHGISTSLGSTRIDEPVYDITKQSKRNEPSDSQESIVLHKNDKLFDGATKQVVGGRSKGKGGGAYEESDNNLDGIFVNTPATHDKENEQGQNSTEFFSKIRFLVRSARAKMKVKYSPGLTDIPEEIQTPKTYKNPAFIEEDSNFRLNKKGHHPFHQYPSSNGGHSFKSFNDVNAKIYKSFRNNKKQQQFRKNEQESSDYSSQEDSLGKRSSSRENCDPLSLDSGVVTNGSVSPTSTTNDHNHGSSDCSSPHNNPETINESHSNCNETTDDEVVDVASEDTDSSDNDGYFDSLKRPGDVTEKSIVETISPQFKSSYGRKGSVLSPNSSIKKPNSIVPNYIVIPPSGRLEKKSHQESMDLLTKLYDKAVLKIPKVIPSDNESLYSDRSNTIQSIDHDSLDPKNIKKVGGGCHKSIDEDSTYEIVECSQDMSPGVYINNMYSPDTLDGKRKSSIVGEKMILSVSGAPQPTSINDQVFTNKLLISVDYNVKNPDNNVSKNNEKSFDPDTLERVEREPSSSFKGKKYFSKFKKDNHPTAIKSLEPPDLPPKINHHSSPNPLPLPSKSAVPPPPPLPPPLPPYTSSNLEKSPDFKSSTKKKQNPKVSSILINSINDEDEEEHTEDESNENMSFQERRERLESSFKARRPESNSSSVLKRIRETEKGDYCGSVPSDGVSKGMEIALNIRSRVANQNSIKSSKHQISNNQNHSISNNKDSFKSSWRKTVEFVGGGGNHLKEDTNNSGRTLKNRPEDSGYISTDSSDSRNRVIKLSMGNNNNNDYDSRSLNQSESSLSSMEEGSSSYDHFEASMLDMNDKSKTTTSTDTSDSVMPLSYRPLHNSDIRTYKL